MYYKVHYVSSTYKDFVILFITTDVPSHSSSSESDEKIPKDTTNSFAEFPMETSTFFTEKGKNFI